MAVNSDETLVDAVISLKDTLKELIPATFGLPQIFHAGSQQSSHLHAKCCRRDRNQCSPTRTQATAAAMREGGGPGTRDSNHLPIRYGHDDTIHDNANDNSDWTRMMKRELDQNAKMSQTFNALMRQFSIFQLDEDGRDATAYQDEVPGRLLNSSVTDRMSAMGLPQECKAATAVSYSHGIDAMQEHGEGQYESAVLSGAQAYSKLIGFPTSSFESEPAPREAQTSLKENPGQSHVFVSRSIRTYTSPDGSITRTTVVRRKGLDGVERIEESVENMNSPSSLSSKGVEVSQIHDVGRSITRSTIGEGWFWCTR